MAHTPKLSDAEYVETNIRSNIELCRKLLEALEALGPPGFSSARKHSFDLLPRLWGLVVGDAPVPYSAAEERNFKPKRGPSSDGDALCITLRGLVRTLEFWMLRTPRPYGCLDLEHFAYRVTALRDGVAPDACVFLQPPPEERELQEEQTRFDHRGWRDHPLREDPSVAAVVAAVEANPGLSTEELTGLLRGESRDPANFS